MTDQPKKHTPPPNRPPAPGKPATPSKLRSKTPPPFVTGGMEVKIIIGEVKITIEGPVVKVLAVMQWLFGEKEPDAVIARLAVKWGPEVSVASKRK